MDILSTYLGELPESENFPGIELSKKVRSNPGKSLFLLEGYEVLNVPSFDQIEGAIASNLLYGEKLSGSLDVETMESFRKEKHHDYYHFVYIRESELLLRIQRTKIDSGERVLNLWRAWPSMRPSDFKSGLPYGNYDIPSYSDCNPGDLFTKDTIDLFLSNWRSNLLENITKLNELFSDKQPAPSFLIESMKSLNQAIIEELTRKPSLLEDMHPRHFEELVAEMLASLGWEVELTATSKDGGYDIFGISNSKDNSKSTWLIECKRYARSRKVGIEIVRSLYGVKADVNEDNAMIVTTSGFTSGAKNFAAGKFDFHLKDHKNLVDWLKQYRRKSNGGLYLH